jgi:hypothetical protein
MNTLGNAPGGHSRAIANWPQRLASPKSDRGHSRVSPDCNLYSTPYTLPYSLLAMFTYLPAFDTPPEVSMLDGNLTQIEES